MEPFSALLAICVGNSPVTCVYPTERPAKRSFADFLWSAPDNREAGDLRRHRTHYDVIVMTAVRLMD